MCIRDSPIPGLYEAGELGSYVSNLYQNGVFLSEAMLSGRTAAQTAFGGESEVKEVVKEEKTGPAWADAADGEYTAVVDGLHDKIEVKMTVEGGKLTAISQEGAGVGASGAELTLRVGPEGTLVLNAPTPIEYVGTGSGFSYTIINEGALIAGVESAEQAQKFLAGGGSLNGVTAQNWYCDAMCYMWANGLLDYTDDGQYAPAAPLSQGTLACLLYTSPLCQCIGMCP